MGYYQKTLNRGRKVVIISANDETGPYTIRLYINNGETPSAFKPGKATTLKGAMKSAERLFNK